MADIAAVADHIPGWVQTVASMAGAVIVWMGGHRLAMRQLRMQERSQDASGEAAAAAATSQVIAQVRTQLDWSQQQHDRYRVEIEQLRQYRYTLDERMAALFEAAIAARTMVHELQRRLGDPDTVFAPLTLPGSAPPMAPKA